jgi:hypothetical protein
MRYNKHFEKAKRFNYGLIFVNAEYESPQEDEV